MSDVTKFDNREILPPKQESLLDKLNPFKSKEFEQGDFVGVRFGLLPSNNGTWSGDRGESVWIPDENHKPECKTPNCRENPGDLTWEEIMAKYDIDGIPFKDGYPDFSEVAVGEVEIDDFGTDRQKNFDQADEKLAEQWTKEGKDGKEWTAEDVKQWRKENNHTWHECEDCKTMQLVPTEVHNNVPHEGGISKAKQQESQQS